MTPDEQRHHARLLMLRNIDCISVNRIRASLGVRRIPFTETDVAAIHRAIGKAITTVTWPHERPAPSDAARYADAADLLDELPVLIRERMRAHGISYRQVAAEAGIASSGTAHRVAYGHGAHTDTATALLRWLARPTPTEEMP